MDLGPFLVKTRGLYLRNSDKPAIVAGQNYYTMATDEDGKPAAFMLKEGDKITRAVYNSDGIMVVRESQLPQLRNEPHMPIYGYRIIEATLQHLLDSTQRWQTPTLEQLYDRLDKFFDTNVDWGNVVNLLNKPVNKLSLVNRVFDETTRLRNLLTGVIYEDDESEWRLHFIRRQGRQILFTQHSDWRTLDWERRKGMGEFEFVENNPTYEKWCTAREDRIEFEQFDKKVQAKEDKHRVAKPKAFSKNDEGRYAI